MGDRMNRVCLGLFAHPDDAEILCGGILTRLKGIGWEVHIATATAGDCGSATLPAARIAAIRRKEAAAAARLIDATYHCLGQRDVNVIFTHASNRRAIDLFRRINPSLVLTHPRVDYMLDHEQTHLLARSAAFAYSIPNASKLPLLPGARIPWLYYVDPLEGRGPDGRIVKPSGVIDITAVIDTKLAMLACHASQRQWLAAHHGMDEYLQAARRHSARRGRLIKVKYAEAVCQHLGHAFPSDDLLKKLLG